MTALSTYFLRNWCERQDAKLNYVQSDLGRYLLCYIKFILQHTLHIVLGERIS